MVTSKRAQSDKVIEFVPFDSNIGQEINDKYQQVLLKEVERSKHLPSAIVLMNEDQDLSLQHVPPHPILEENGWEEVKVNWSKLALGIGMIDAWMKSVNTVQLVPNISNELAAGNRQSGWRGRFGRRLDECGRMINIGQRV